MATVEDALDFYEALTANQRRGLFNVLGPPTVEYTAATNYESLRDRAAAERASQRNATTLHYGLIMLRSVPERITGGYTLDPVTHWNDVYLGSIGWAGETQIGDFLARSLAGVIALPSDTTELERYVKRLRSRGAFDHAEWDEMYADYLDGEYDVNWWREGERPGPWFPAVP